jgi:hypothetical protein
METFDGLELRRIKRGRNAHAELRLAPLARVLASLDIGAVYHLARMESATLDERVQRACEDPTVFFEEWGPDAATSYRWAVADKRFDAARGASCKLTWDGIAADGKPTGREAHLIVV